MDEMTSLATKYYKRFSNENQTKQDEKTGDILGRGDIFNEL